MSDYPVHCDDCGKYLMERHAMEEQTKVLCSDCFRKRNPEGYYEYDEFIKWSDKAEEKKE